MRSSHPPEPVTEKPFRIYLIRTPGLPISGLAFRHYAEISVAPMGETITFRLLAVQYIRENVHITENAGGIVF